MITGRVRTSVRRWKRFARILASLERCFEYSSRLDAHTEPYDEANDDAVKDELQELAFRMRRLEKKIDKEFDLLTADMLMVRLQERKQRENK